MPYSIGLAGKGGTGKTTIAGLLVKYLVENSMTPVLAVDADANANLNEVLGLEVEETLGDAREEMKKGVSSGITKDVFMEMKLQEAVIESAGFDLVVMGRPEGAGCYCAANSLLTQYLEKLIDNYAYVVMDNEAGMEHISRRTTRDVDHLLLVTDASQRALTTAERILEMIPGLEVNIQNKYLIVNRLIDGRLPAPLAAAIDKLDVELAGTIPSDAVMAEFEFSGRPLIELPADTMVVQSAFQIAARILSGH
jgi:CO dehydrogenase maturation factor